VGYTEDFPIIQYADDILLIILRAILNSFVASTGLKVNYSKSNMFPINVSQERLQHLAATFNCQVGAFSFTYLGLPKYEQTLCTRLHAIGNKNRKEASKYF
jgi:hypothetical protein